MEMFNDSAWFVTSSTSRPGNPEPELSLVTTKDKIKINEAAAKLLDVKAGEYMMFVANKSGQYAIAKGVLEYSSDGEVMKGVDKRTGAEIDRYRGAKMASTTGKAGYGILGGSDVNNWAPLRIANKVPADKIAVFDVAKEAIVVPGAALGFHSNVGDVSLYPIKFARVEDKIERGESEGEQVEPEESDN